MTPLTSEVRNLDLICTLPPTTYVPLSISRSLWSLRHQCENDGAGQDDSQFTSEEREEQLTLLIYKRLTLPRLAS